MEELQEIASFLKAQKPSEERGECNEPIFVMSLPMVRIFRLPNTEETCIRGAANLFFTPDPERIKIDKENIQRALASELPEDQSLQLADFLSDSIRTILTLMKENEASSERIKSMNEGLESLIRRLRIPSWKIPIITLTANFFFRKTLLTSSRIAGLALIRNEVLEGFYFTGKKLTAKKNDRWKNPVEIQSAPEVPITDFSKGITLIFDTTTETVIFQTESNEFPPFHLALALVTAADIILGKKKPPSQILKAAEILETYEDFRDCFELKRPGFFKKTTLFKPADFTMRSGKLLETAKTSILGLEKDLYV